MAYIVKNEAQFFEASLRSLGSWAAEILVVDSGSTDATLAIAESIAATRSVTILHRPWTDDFSAARNFALDQAKQPWIFFVDGDEIVDPAAEILLSQLVHRESPPQWASVIQRNYVADPTYEMSVACIPPAFLDRSETQLYYADNWMERMVFRDSDLARSHLRYEGRIHESLVPCTERLHFRHERCPLILHHMGRLKNTHTQKLRYYLQLSQEKIKDNPDDAVAWIEFLTTANELLLAAEALPAVEDALQRFPTHPEILRMSFQTLLRADAFAHAQSIIHRYLELVPHDPYAETQLTTALLYQRRFAELETLGRKLLKQDPENLVVHINLAVAYFEHKDWKQAKEHLAIAHRIKPSDVFVATSLQKVDAQLQNN